MADDRLLLYKKLFISKNSILFALLALVTAARRLLNHWHLSVCLLTTLC